MLRISLLLVLLLTCTPTTEAQSTLAVPAQFATIQGAISAAVSGDTVEVSPGTYTENLNFQGKQIVVRGLQGAAATVIDGGNSGPCAVFVFGEGPSSALEGFTLTNGLGVQLLVGPNGPVTAGGGLYCLGSSPSIRRCVFLANSATRGGAAEISGSPVFEDCVFDGNSATGAGGALSILPAGFPALVACRLTNNSSAIYGGAVACAAGTNLLAVNCLLDGNALVPTSANLNVATGSAFYLQSGTGSLILEGVTVTGNTAGPGATIGSDGSLAPLVINNSLVWGNSGPALGGSGSGTVTHSNFEGGHAGVGNMDLDPLFADPLNGDFSLAPGSPCMNAGASGSPFMGQLDLAGVPRVIWSAPDLGAFESADISGSPYIGGNVAVGPGGSQQVLRINGLTGGTSRRVYTAIGQPNWVEVVHPLTNAVPSHFAIYGFFGVPGPSDSVALPLGIGNMVMLPCPMYPWGHPLLFTLTNSTGVDICGQLIASHPTPWISPAQPGIFFPLTVTFQGVIEEIPGTFRVTNGIILVVE